MLDPSTMHIVTIVPVFLRKATAQDRCAKTIHIPCVDKTVMAITLK